MEQQFQIFFDKIKIEMDMQTTTITNSLLQKIEEKLQPIIEENKNLKEKIEVLENKINKLENYKKKNNLLLFRLEETEKSSLDLFNTKKEQKEKFTFIKCDRLIVKEGNATNIEKRKGEESTSLGIKTNSKKQINMPTSSKTHRKNAYDLMRDRSNSNSSLPSINKTN
ncbi:unnamed protein product [Euphydryas editha]|uniref:Uncharacterized protein n=1 Tax=Euphydryas editha TaxID=104508 RepID=A0AAU9UYH9_EUPED|nr:unnamed protein product [Euphydryas editha]